jgi:hypothetical protein
MPDVAAASQRSSERSTVLLLAILVIGLAAAAIWFVWLPLIQEPAARSCEVYVMPSGTTKCVPYGKPRSWTAHPATSTRRSQA